MQTKQKHRQLQTAVVEKKRSIEDPSKIGNSTTVGGPRSGVVLTCITDYKNQNADGLLAPKRSSKPDYLNSDELKFKTSSKKPISVKLKPKTSGEKYVSTGLKSKTSSEKYVSSGLKSKTSGEKRVCIEGISVKPLTSFTIPKVRSQSTGNRLYHFEI